MKRIIFVYFHVIFLTFLFTDLDAQSYDAIGSGRAIYFDGIDDYINLGNRFDDLSLPVTISVWVNVNSNMTYAFPIFNSQDNLPLYNGITFAVSPTAFSIQYGDGRGENNPAFRRGKSASIPNISGRWVNLTAIMRGSSDMDLFLNGINIGGQYSGNSDLPMESLSPNDDSKIGFWYSNGITTYYKGLMDELRIYNRSLSETEIRAQMCKSLSGNEAGLIGYWTFDEINGNVLKDKSVNKFDGLLSGDPTRVFSGAPLGNQSTFLYTANWSNKSLALGRIEAVNIQGNPGGIHIYEVMNVPSQTTGLDASQVNKPYYGVFLASLDIGNSFDLKRDGAQAGCKVYNRGDNSEALWKELVIFSSLIDRKEIIPAIEEKMEEIDLGADRILCDQTGYTLTSNINTTGKTILWSTGETTNSINIQQSGVYSLQVISSCALARDTVAITFLSEPTSFSFGDDEALCILASKVLKPDVDSQDVEFEWQDGSKADTFKVQDFGMYWVTVKNFCGVETDTLKITKLNIALIDLPNIITPNGDPLNQYFVLNQEITGTHKFLVYNRWGEKVFASSDYKNDWDGSGLSTGIYYYQLNGECLGEKKGTITISR